MNLTFRDAIADGKRVMVAFHNEYTFVYSAEPKGFNAEISKGNKRIQRKSFKSARPARRWLDARYKALFANTAHEPQPSPTH